MDGNNNSSTGVTLSLVGSWIMLILFFWTIFFLIISIINIKLLNDIKKGNQEHLVASSVLSILFGGLLGIIGGIMMLVEK